MQKLSFDIETVPQENLSDIQLEELNKKISRSKEDLTENELRNKICATSPYLGKIICIGLHMQDTDGDEESLALTGDEDKIIRRLWGILGKQDDTQFVSYNGISFDVPFIAKRSMYYGIIPTNYNFLKVRRYASYPHFDVKELISDWDKFSAPTLKLACDLFGVPSPKEGEVKAENVYEAYLNGGIGEIAEYCVRDTVATLRVADKLMPFLV